MQSVHRQTIDLINRCCTHAEFLQGYNKLKSAGIRTCLHIINGLPGETEKMMLETARQTAELAPDGVKQTDFFRIKAWKKLGEICGRYLRKGKKIAVIGELQAYAYEANENDAH